MFAGVPPEVLTDTCGSDPGVACERVLRTTDNRSFAELAAWIVDRPLRVALILLGAWIINRLARRMIKNVVNGVTGVEKASPLRRLRDKTPSVLLATGPHSLRAESRAQTISLVLRSIATTLIVAIAVTMALAEVNLDIGPLIAGAGIAGIALGFGAQSLVKDFLAGLFMLVEDQFGVGDVVDVGEARGTVEAVSLRTTRIRDVEGTVWHVPNGTINRVGNKSQQWARSLVDVEVAYDTDLEHAKQVIARIGDAMWAEPELREKMLEQPEIWGVESLGKDGIVLRVVIKTLPGEQFKVTRALRERLKVAFEKNDISIPFPQRMTWVRRDPGTSMDGNTLHDEEAAAELE